MSLGSVLQLVRGSVVHDHVGIKHGSLKELAAPNVNIVHVRRPQHAPSQELRKLVAQHGHYRAQVAVAAADPERKVHQLVHGLRAPPATASKLQQDICDLVQQYSELMAAADPAGLQLVHAKLEVLGHTPCPKWHADHVAARLLVTYCGPGTWFVANRYVKRRRSLAGGPLTVSVASVQEQHAEQAGEGDLLLLKGHDWPGSYGLGAVHRSPLVQLGDEGGGEGSMQRLLLTIDDAVHEAGAGHGPGCAC
mmetsp:Transcript_27650/g.70429  ORF Transcript_27650/g.70429 Transcript_27650/m.70429 type:complete len:250 (-) Transcript_27650:243-992(-)